MRKRTSAELKRRTGADMRAQRDQRMAPGPMLEAARRAQSIRDGLNSFANAIDQMADAYNREDWKALGYASWQDYCQGEFGPRVRLTVEQRRQAAASLTAAGLTKRAAAAALGVSHTTVQNDDRGNKLPRPVIEGQVKTDAEVADEVARAAAAFDAMNSGNVSTPPSDVPGQAAADTDTASADGSPVPEPVGKAGGEPAGQDLTVEVLPGKPQDSPADSVRDEVALVASQPGPFQDLTDGQTPPPSMGSVLSPAAVPGVAAAGDEVGEESEAGPLDSSSTDPASEWMAGWRGLVAAAFSLRSEFTEEEMGEIRDDIVTLGRIFRHA